MKKLTTLNKKFLREYIKHPNGAAAARACGLSEKNAKGYASSLLKRPEAKEYLRKLENWEEADAIIKSERVLEEFSRIAVHDIGAYYHRNLHGIEKLKSLDELTPEQRACVKSIDVLEGKIEFWDKMTALDRMGKHYKLFTEISEQRHTFTMMGDIKVGGVKLEFNIGTPAPKRGA